MTLALVIALTVIAQSSQEQTPGVCLPQEGCTNSSPTDNQRALLQTKHNRTRSAVTDSITAAINPSGSAAPLTQEGYAAVADRCCQAEMIQFIQRVVFEQGFEVCEG